MAVISHLGWLAKEELRQVKAELASMLAAKVGCSGCSSLEWRWEIRLCRHLPGTGNEGLKSPIINLLESRGKQNHAYLRVPQLAWERVPSCTYATYHSANIPSISFDHGHGRPSNCRWRGYDPICQGFCAILGNGNGLAPTWQPTKCLGNLVQTRPGRCRRTLLPLGAMLIVTKCHEESGWVCHLESFA